MTRQDGSEEKKVCETRSFLVHDFTHLAFELEAKTNKGFWGSVSKGSALSELSGRDSIARLDEKSEAMQIEKTVAILQGLTKGTSAESIVSAVERQKENFDWARPEWFEFDFVCRIDRRLKALLGQWKSIKFGESIVVMWESMD